MTNLTRRLVWSPRACHARRGLLLAAAGCALALMLGRSVAGADEPLYHNDFEKIPVGTELGDAQGFMVIEGRFIVREDQGNRFAELPGSPLGGFAMLFGPSQRDGLAVSARIYGTRRGRRYPVFGVGLNGMGGYRLLVAPAKRALELWRGETRLTSLPFRWKSGAWTHLRLQLRSAGSGVWKVAGKAWSAGSPEPEDWMVVYEDKTEPFAGKPSIWGEPFADTPIRFDDLTVTAAE